MVAGRGEAGVDSSGVGMGKDLKFPVWSGL